jgi:hypothetical protein
VELELSTIDNTAIFKASKLKKWTVRYTYLAQFASNVWLSQKIKGIFVRFWQKGGLYLALPYLDRLIFLATSYSRFLDFIRPKTTQDWI